MFTVGIITISDKGAAGLREDGSGRLLHELVASFPAKVGAYEIIPDEKEAIRKALLAFADDVKVDLILTTGGTGISPRDLTPGVTADVIDTLIPGIGEIMRVEGYRLNPRAVISRGIAGLRGQTLIVNFPGSTRAVRENFEILFPVLPHAIEKMQGLGGDCG